jgi:PhnB protein
MQVQAYLNFDGRTEEAIEFYRKAIGAEVQMLMRNKESPEPPPPGTLPPGSENKVMHATFRIGDSTVMASDCHAKGAPVFQGISLSLTVDNAAQSEKCFGALSAGGKVNMPLAKTFFSPSFGVVTDKFGVTWMIYVPGEQG